MNFGNYQLSIAIVAVLIPAAIALVGMKRIREQHLKEFSLNLISSFYSSDNVAKGHEILIRALPNGMPDKIDSKDEYFVRQALNFYSFIAVAYCENTVDRRIIMLQLGNSIKSAFSSAQSLVDKQRVEMDRPTMYQLLEEFSVKRVDEFYAENNRYK